MRIYLQEINAENVNGYAWITWIIYNRHSSLNNASVPRGIPCCRGIDGGRWSAEIGPQTCSSLAGSWSDRGSACGICNRRIPLDVFLSLFRVLSLLWRNEVASPRLLILESKVSVGEHVEAGRELLRLNGKNGQLAGLRSSRMTWRWGFRWGGGRDNWPLKPTMSPLLTRPWTVAKSSSPLWYLAFASTCKYSLTIYKRIDWNPQSQNSSTRNDKIPFQNVLSVLVTWRFFPSPWIS